MIGDKPPLYKFLSLFQDIPESDLGVIGEAFRIRQVKTGEVLLSEGKIARELFFVASGILKIITVNEKGNGVIQFFIKENKFCTILYSFNEEVVSAEGIVAATEAELFVISKTELGQLYEKLPYFKGLIEGISNRTLLDKIQFRNSLMGEDASTRYLKFVLQQPDIVLRVPLSDVASYLGITQQSLSRIRKNVKFLPFGK